MQPKRVKRTRKDNCASHNAIKRIAAAILDQAEDVKCAMAGSASAGARPARLFTVVRTQGDTVQHVSASNTAMPRCGTLAAWSATAPHTFLAAGIQT